MLLVRVLAGASDGGSDAGSPQEASAAIPPGFSARGPLSVERVVDGDTILVGGVERVRVLGINTPEMRHANPVVQALARAARTETERFLGSHPVQLLVGLPATDKHGRTLAYVHVTGGVWPLTDLGAHLLASGHAQVFPAPHPRLDEYRALERTAREEGRGLWGEPGSLALQLVPEAVVPAEEARHHVGHRVVVVGTVQAARRTAAGLFIDLGEARPAPFQAVALAGQLVLFPPGIEDGWRGQRIAVTGVVSEYRGRIQVLLEYPEDIRLEAEGDAGP